MNDTAIQRARYWGTEGVGARALVPRDDARLGEIRFEDRLARPADRRAPPSTASSAGATAPRAASV